MIRAECLFPEIERSSSAVDLGIRRATGLARRDLMTSTTTMATMIPTKPSQGERRGICRYGSDTAMFVCITA